MNETESRAREEAQMAKAFQEEISFLRIIPMFSGLGDCDLARLCQVAMFRSHPAGSVLLREGETNNSLCIIRNGVVTLSRNSANPSASLRLTTGRFFGQVSMFDPSPASATARAETDVDVVCLRWHAFNDLLVAHPGVGARLLLAIIQDLAKRYRTLLGQVNGKTESMPVCEKSIHPSLQ